MDNLTIYNAVRKPPEEALKTIQAGRLKGKSDINPMWRIKELTERFGPCGIGWKYVITKQWLEPGGKDEIAAFVNIDLYYKYNGEWSEPIPGTGGSSFVANESRGPYVSDECFKMALTDAISVSCKALGFAADVYWNSDKTKYDKSSQEEQKPGNHAESTAATNSNNTTAISGNAADGNCSECGNTINQSVKNFSVKKFGKPLCMICQKKQAQGAR